jgi:hypothetical protein
MYRLSWVLMTIVAGLGLLAGPAGAATASTISGRVYNLSTGQGYAGATVYLCNGGTVKTGPTGNWQVTVASGTVYCARVTAGAPVGLIAGTRNNSQVGASQTYENQVAGANCYHNPSCLAQQQAWDRSVDGGTDFAYMPQPSVPALAAKPAAPVAPTAVVAATPKPTDEPALIPTSSPSAAPSPTVTPVAAVASGTPSPTPPPTRHFTSVHLSSGTLINTAAIATAIITIFLAVALVPWRAQKRRTFQEYLRAKYYDL